MRFVQGNLLESKVEALVNTVNTLGVIGKGIALMFKEAFPANFLAYVSSVPTRLPFCRPTPMSFTIRIFLFLHAIETSDLDPECRQFSSAVPSPAKPTEDKTLASLLKEYGGDMLVAQIDEHRTKADTATRELRGIGFICDGRRDVELAYNAPATLDHISVSSRSAIWPPYPQVRGRRTTESYGSEYATGRFKDS